MKKSMTSLGILIIALVVSTILCQPFAAPAAFSAPGPTVKTSSEKDKGSWKIEWDKTVEAAKKEGKVLIYSTPSNDIMRALAEVFEKKYGIKVEWISGRGEEWAQRMLSEKNAGIRAVDVIIAGGTITLTVVKPQGLLGKIDPLLILPEVIDPQAWITKGLPYTDKAHTSMPLVATFQRYVLRNTNMVKENEITSYKDLLNPKWKGKIVMNDPTVVGTANAFFGMLALDIWGIEESKNFMRQLVRQEPVITRDRRLQVEWVARGKYALSLATNLENAIEFINMAAPVAFCKVKEGGKVGSGAGGLSVPEIPAHPNASKVFVNWILSKEGQSVFVKAYGSPGVRKDAPREGISPQLFPDPDEKFYDDTEESILYRGEMTKIAKDIFAPLFK